MRILSLAGLLVLGLACRHKVASKGAEVGRTGPSRDEAAGGPDDWRKACTHARNLGSEIDIETCVGEYASYPREVADEVARCALGIEAPDETREKTLACVGERGRVYFAKRELAVANLKRHVEAIDRLYPEHGLPESLAELGDGFGGPDPWGTTWAYTSQPADFVICSAGPDLNLGTSDDLCDALHYTYFPF